MINIEFKKISENKIPHSNLIGAIARELGYKVSYKHYYISYKIQPLIKEELERTSK